ncbi:PHP-associated domain-containing protein [Salinibaculum salinum]|uniref:PHP-associated domain-containing protein n=1 Tax=Salinibaculum salinum TaxID=3131996 RepID=UPI0030EEAF5F
MHVKILDERVVERAKRRGIDVLVYAPHFTRWTTIRKRAERFSDDDLLVVPARELFTGDWRNRRHVLALDLQRGIPDFLTLDGAMNELAKQDAVVCVPHPGFLTISLEREHIREYREHVDAIEVYNPKHLARDNRRARALASEFDLPGFTSSYAHLSGTIGECWTAFDRDIDTAADLHAALRDGMPRTATHRDGLGHLKRRAIEIAHIGYENTWKKLDRVYLSGTEPTHPDHVAYGGAFDDSSVY